MLHIGANRHIAALRAQPPLLRKGVARTVAKATYTHKDHYLTVVGGALRPPLRAPTGALTSPSPESSTRGMFHFIIMYRCSPAHQLPLVPVELY